MSLCVFAAAREAPDQPALVLGRRTWTYAELAARAAGALFWLESRGLSPGMADPPLVALEASNSESSLVMLYALISAGIPVLPLHPRLNDAEREAQVRTASAQLRVDDDWRDQIPVHAASSVRLPLEADERWLAVVFTSGTTGSAKGVALSRRAFAASAWSSEQNLGWQAGDRWLLCLPVAHVGGLSIVTRCLLGRRCVVVAPTSSEPCVLRNLLAEHRVTLLSLVPTQLARCLAAQPRWEPPKALRAVLLGGAATGSGLLEEARARHVPILPTYGLTETCSQITTQRYPPGAPTRRHSGPPLRGAEIACPGGVIHVRGAMLFSAYLGAGRVRRPDEWFCTDDHGALDDQGNLHVLGRRDELLNTGGENVSALEVEEVLERCPWIKEACVVGIPDELWGESLGAVIVLDEAARASADVLLQHVNSQLSSFKRPRFWAVVPALPRTHTGKVDRAAARHTAAGRWRSSPG